MAEAEELLAEGALVATRFAHDLWRRHRAAPEVARLADVRERIECFVIGLRGACPTLGISSPPLQRTWLGRLLLRIPRHLNSATAQPATDGQRVLLPRELAPLANDLNALCRYRLYALAQALRIERKTHTNAPLDRLERDLFIARDGLATLTELAAEVPRLNADIAACVRASLATRPATEQLTPLEQAVEARLRSALRDALSPQRTAASVPAGHELLAEVIEAAAALRANFPGRYRGLPSAECWGELVEAGAPTLLAPAAFSREAAQRSPPRLSHLARRPTPRVASADEDDERPGMFIVKADASQTGVEDPLGLSRPLDEGAADAAELSAALSELPEARLIRAPGAVREVLLSEGRNELRAAQSPLGAPNSGGFSYPEWDYRISSYRQPGALVRESVAEVGDVGWAETVLRRHARLLHTVCESFAELRPRRSRLLRQPDGMEVDIDAYVSAFANRLAGVSWDDALYEDVRPRRRDVALLLLVDASASTDASISGRQRIIDIEKEALLVVCKALERLGDRYAAYGFSGESAAEVRVRAIKRFDEPYDIAVERRIAGLEPDGYTRLGAAVRRATGLLAREQARHRLLLIVSDGKPNDIDEYEGRYGIEDARQAIVEARLQGLHPFCLTVDRQAPEYARHIFGPTGYTLLRDAQLLPATLLELLRRLVRA